MLCSEKCTLKRKISKAIRKYLLRGMENILDHELCEKLRLLPLDLDILKNRGNWSLDNCFDILNGLSPRTFIMG